MAAFSDSGAFGKTGVDSFFLGAPSRATRLRPKSSMFEELVFNSLGRDDCVIESCALKCPASTDTFAEEASVEIIERS